MYQLLILAYLLPPIFIVMIGLALISPRLQPAKGQSAHGTPHAPHHAKSRAHGKHVKEHA
jgi:hypothetical protein